MLSDEQLRKLLRNGEADHVERTRQLADKAKIGEAICALANDLSDRREMGVIFIGVNDDGSCANQDISENMLQTLMGFRTDGNILPPPVIAVRRHILDGCTMAIVEVTPSDNPPLKYNGRVCVRIGPRRGYATAEEERRLTEKRRWGNLPFDQQPVPGATTADLDTLRFREEYLPSAVAPDVLAENQRPLAQQLRAAGFIGPNDVPTAVGLLVCGKDPRDFFSGAYVQFVRYPGTEIGDLVRDQKEIGGPLSDVLRRLDEIIDLNISEPADLRGVLQETRPSYPALALRELIRNAVIHRNYENSGAPVTITWYNDRIEILSPGGPYGEVTRENFAQRGLTCARNPALASAAKEMGFVQRFGSGIPRAQKALADNGNRPLEFLIEPNFVHVTVRARP